MLSHTPPVIIHPQYSCDDAGVDHGRKPKRERRLRHTSPSPTRSRFLRIVRHHGHGDDHDHDNVDDHEDATNGKHATHHHHHGLMRLLDVVRRHGHDHDDATENGERPPHHNGHVVKRSLSYHDIEQAAASAAWLGSGPGVSGKDAHERDAADMSTAAAVSSNGPVGGPSTHHLSVEEDHTRQRRSSGGSHHHLFSLGLRFGGRGKAEKKKKDKKGAGDLPSPGVQDPSLGDPDLTLYR